MVIIVPFGTQIVDLAALCDDFARAGEKTCRVGFGIGTREFR
jgi:hypothetical protein